MNIAPVFVSEQTPSRGIENANVVKKLQSLYANVQEGKDLDKTIKQAVHILGSVKDGDV